jgi:hypothetical protein
VFQKIFNQHFEITNISSDILKTSSVQFWAKDLKLIVNNSKDINLILHDNLKLTKKCVKSAGSCFCWIGLKKRNEILIDTISDCKKQNNKRTLDQLFLDEKCVNPIYEDEE